TVARNNSVSNHSAARSATAIGPQRNNLYSSFFPRLRNARPTFPSCHTSFGAGRSIEGGVIVASGASTRPIREKLLTNSGYASASFEENGLISSCVRDTSL